MSIEFKQTDPSIVPQVANLLDAHNAWDHTTLMSFFDPPIIELRERQPTALTALTILEGLAFMDADEDYVAPGQHLLAVANLCETACAPNLDRF